MQNLQGHKSNDMITLPLDIPDVAVLSVRQDQRGDYIITVESQLEGTRCQYCGRKLSQLHGHGRWIKLRHLPILGRRVYLRLRPKQYICPDCGDKLTTQQPDWYAARSPHTKAYDEYLMLSLVNSTIGDVRQKEGLGYDAVKGAVQRSVRTRVDWAEFDELGVIGIDEIALRKGRKDYVAIITAQQAAGRLPRSGPGAARRRPGVQPGAQGAVGRERESGLGARPPLRGSAQGSPAALG